MTYMHKVDGRIGSLAEDVEEMMGWEDRDTFILFPKAALGQFEGYLKECGWIAIAFEGVIVAASGEVN